MKEIFKTKAVEFANLPQDWENIIVDNIAYRADIERDPDDEDYTYVIFYLEKNYPKHQHYVITVKNNEIVDYEDRSSWEAAE
jgi:hypothetical protein